MKSMVNLIGVILFSALVAYLFFPYEVGKAVGGSTVKFLIGWMCGYGGAC